MRMITRRPAIAAVGVMALVLAGCTASGGAQSGQSGSAQSGAASAGNTTNAYISEQMSDGKTSFTRVLNPNGGQTLSYATDGSMKIIEQKDGEFTYAFKDMNANGTLDPFEDWRLDAAKRAADLAPKLSKEQQAGLMLFSSHERAPGDGLTDKQKDYLQSSHLRAVLNAGNSDAKQNVQWVNEMQAFVETLANEKTPYVPVNYSSDPRSDGSKAGAFTQSGEISTWPSSLGLAATFSPETVQQFGQMVSAEYRALGIGTALSPQIDLASEPRWLRVSGTFGEDSDMAAKMAKAYVDGFQGTYDESGQSIGWGDDSVAAMIKHWPGDGSGEGGRESHTAPGKYAVYPGGNQAEHEKVFIGALNSSAIMTSYSIGVGADGKPAYSALMGTSYDKGKLDALREKNAYQGVVVTDWAVTTTVADDPEKNKFGMAWGAESLTPEQRHFEVLKNGTDMFGGNNAVGPVLAAYDMWQSAHAAGQLPIDAPTRWAQSAARILTLSFNNDGFDNPYLVLEDSQATVGSQDKVDAGRQAQLNSIVLLKNSNNAINFAQSGDFKDKVVYVPHTHDLGFPSVRGPAEYTHGASLDIDTLKKYFKEVVTDEVVLDGEEKVKEYKAPDLSKVDLVLVGMRSPNNGNNFSKAGFNEADKSYYPLSLQYRPYTADGENVRKTSISGDTLPDGSKENRSYFGKTSHISNEADLDAFERATKAVEASGKKIPVVTVLKASNPVIPTEFEAKSDALLVGFGTADEALIQVALGQHSPAGRLPIQFPADMNTVEANKEDVPKDVTPYKDSAGNVYDFGFGLGADGKPLAK
ncbi:MAG: glycoside hydrolase family 3 N-terminal domain-containing protein [Actinomycetaceae bacterium]|nr:glycoside hydrolase family 3 N-terminal domain-containing protein [Actinomycetaceae bacterium]